MGTEKKHGLMDESTKAITEILRKMGLELSFGMMEICIRVNGETISRMEKEFTST